MEKNEPEAGMDDGDAVETDLSRLSEKIEHLEEELEKERQRGGILQEALEDCKEHIFKMQPVQAATDTEITQQYQAFCAAIELWVRRQFPKVKSVLQNLPHLHIDKSLFQKLTYYFRTGEFNLLLRYPGSEGAITRYLVHRHLQAEIIDDDRFHSALRENLNKFLGFIEDGMRQLKPKRAAETINNWKADVRMALAKNPDLASERASLLHHVVEDIKTIFYPLLRPKLNLGWENKDAREIVRLAASFKDTVHYCPKRYICEYDFSPADDRSKRALFPDDFSKYTILDAATSHVVRTQKGLQEDARGRIGLLLCVIHPALRSLDADTGEKTTLVGPTVLAELYRREERDVVRC